MTASKFTLDFEKPLQNLVDQLDKLKSLSSESDMNLAEEIKGIEAKIAETKEKIYSKLTAWQKIKIARHPKRPYSCDYIEKLFDDFQELHGDRSYGDDQALIGGTAFFDGMPVMILAQQKGRNLKENIRRNFGSPQPEGYRKALRLMKMAEKFGLPVISFIDTPGAYPGIEAEERHVAEAIAVNLREMSNLKVPTVGIVIGEGGSGGALGIAVSDRILILEYAYYSVISPEGCAAILWKNREKAPDAAEVLKISADQLKKLKVVDLVVKEPFGGAHNDLDEAAKNIKLAIKSQLNEIVGLSHEELLDKRYAKYRAMGQWKELPASKDAVEEKVVENPQK